MTNSSALSTVCWYLLASKPKQEFRAEQHLRNLGLQANCPRYRLEKIIKGKKTIVEEPLFKGYLFVNISRENPVWSKIRSTRGVKDWVRFAGEPAKLPESVVEAIISHSPADKVAPAFSYGEKVTIKRGPFAGLEAVFESEDGEFRSVLLIDFLGKYSRIRIENESITKI